MFKNLKVSQIFKNDFEKAKEIFNFNFSKDIKNIVKFGISFSFIIVLISVLILSLYITTNQSYILYSLGTLLFKSFTMFIAIFFICGIAFNTIIKERLNK